MLPNIDERTKERLEEQKANRYFATAAAVNIGLAGILSIIPGWSSGFYVAFFWVSMGSLTHAIVAGWVKRV